VKIFFWGPVKKRKRGDGANTPDRANETFNNKVKRQKKKYFKKKNRQRKWDSWRGKEVGSMSGHTGTIEKGGRESCFKDLCQIRGIMGRGPELIRTG